MRFTNIEYTNCLYDKKYEFQISQKPIVLLLGQDYLNNSEIKNLFYKKIPSQMDYHNRLYSNKIWGIYR